MNHSLHIFNYEDAQVRTIVKEGEPWFYAQDLAAVLGYSATSAMLKRLDEDERTIETFLEGTTYKKQSLISESGLYSAVMGSQLESAKRFKKWVTNEVLPSIRKNGGYIQTSPDMSDNEIMAKAILLAQTTIEKQKQQIAVKDEAIAILAPKAEAHDRIALADGSVCITDAAKILQMRPAALFGRLSGLRWIYRRTGGAGWIAYQDKIQQGLLEHKVTTVARGDGSEKITEQVRVTPKGLTKLAGMQEATA